MSSPTIKLLEFLLERKCVIEFKEKMDMAWHNSERKHFPNLFALTMFDRFNDHVTEIGLSCGSVVQPCEWKTMDALIEKRKVITKGLDV